MDSLHPAVLLSAASGNGTGLSAPNQLIDLLQNVANGVLSAEDAAVQLNQVAPTSGSPDSSAESANTKAGAFMISFSAIAFIIFFFP
jgi:hypothetical protein